METSIQNLPTELQQYILKYMTYSPTSKCIQDNQEFIENKQVWIQYLDKYFDIFNHNCAYKAQRIFNQTIIIYLNTFYIRPETLPPNFKNFYHQKLLNVQKVLL